MYTARKWIDMQATSFLSLIGSGLIMNHKVVYGRENEVVMAHEVV